MTVTATIRIPNRNIDDARNTEGIPVENQEKENKKRNPNILNTHTQKVIPSTIHHHMVLINSN